MSARLDRAIADVERIDRKIIMYQEQKKEALARLRQVENEEIIRAVRTMNLSRRELSDLLKGIQEGTVSFADIEKETSGVDLPEERSTASPALEAEPTDNENKEIESEEMDEDKTE